MLLKLIENLELYERFLNRSGAVRHYDEHVTKTYKDFFDHVFDEVDFKNHKDKVPPISFFDYVLLAEKLQDEPRAHGFVIQDVKKSNELAYVKFRKVWFSDLFQWMKRMKKDYLKECEAAHENLIEKEDNFIKSLNKIHDSYYEVVFFTSLGKDSTEVVHGNAKEGDLRTISYYITSNLKYLFLRKVDELPTYYNKTYFPLMGVDSEKYRELVSKSVA